MIEPEIAFADLEDDMILAESMLKICHQLCVRECAGRDGILQQLYR